MSTPILNKLLEVAYDRLQNIQDVFEYLRDNTGINTATGIWLDQLGDLVGLERPYREQAYGTIFAYKGAETDIDDPFKAFENGGVGGYYQTTDGLKYLADPTERMGDTDYRTRILGKGVANWSSGIITDVWRYLTTGFDLTNPTVESTPGAVNVTIAEGEFMTQGDRQLAQEKGPVAAGIGLNIDNWTDEHLPFVDGVVNPANWDIVAATIDSEASKSLKTTAAVGITSIDKTVTHPVTAAESAYGTWSMWIKSPAAVNLWCAMIATDNASYNPAGQYGYGFVVVGTDFWATELDNGVQSVKFTKTSAITDGVWHKVTITRDALDEFTYYIDDVQVVPTTGSNPFTDSTTTSGKYWVFETRTNDEIGLSVLDDDTKLTTYTPL